MIKAQLFYRLCAKFAVYVAYLFSSYMYTAQVEYRGCRVN